MPKKYLAMPEDIMVFSSVATVYSMIKPVEDKLKAAGYKGPTLADFDNTIYKELGLVDKEATRIKQQKADKKKGSKAPAVPPVYKSTKEHFLKVGDKLKNTGKGIITMDNNQLIISNDYTDSSDKEFHKYLDKFDKYLDLLIANTPEEEYKDELTQLKFQKANTRVIKTFGSRKVFSNQLGFASTVKGLDSGLKIIKEPGVPSSGVSRELFKKVYQNYPYSDVLNASTDLINVICDYEENKEKNTYTEQLKYRDNYRKAVKNFLDVSKSLANGPELMEKMAKQEIREGVIKAMKKADGDEKNVDYEAIIKRVEAQQKNGEQPSPEDSEIVKKINDAVDKKYTPAQYERYNSRYSSELSAMGFKTNETDFTGTRGLSSFYNELNAQLNAIDMGWPMDELIHIQRMTTFFREGISLKERDFTPEDQEKIRNAKRFYDERIKDKPYPDTEEKRQEFYRDFYEVAKSLKEASRQKILDGVNDKEYSMAWDEFTDEIKATMSKPLTFAQKLALKHVQQNADTQLTAESVNELKTGINKDRFGHSNSDEYKALKNAFGKFDAAFAADKEGFAVTDNKDLSADKIKILEELRASADKYLKEKDTEKKLPEDRSEMGKLRYESAQKAFHLADKLLKQQEAKKEKAAEAKKQADREKGRKEMREIFFNPDSKAGKAAVKFDKLKAGSEEEYNRLKAEEARKDAEAAAKAPVTDEEKYDKYINDLRLKKEDPVSVEDEVLNKEMQQRRVDDLGNMLAAMELKAAGKPFDKMDIIKRGGELKTIYSLNTLKKSGGNEKLKNALTYEFRADALKRELEQAIYEVGKSKYKNTNEAQSKYQTDITELLERKKPDVISPQSQKMIDALNEIKSINTEDKDLAALNSYKMGKANKQLMEAISESLTGINKLDMDAYGHKLALDSLAVMSTYTNCKSATNELLRKVNAKVRSKDGGRPDINVNEFEKNFGVKHSKELAQKMSARRNVNANDPAAAQNALQGRQPTVKNL